MKKASPSENSGSGNPKLAEIFDEKNFSARFFHYQRNETPRGAALYLCQIMIHLKRAFPEQAPIIDNAITTIRQISLETDEELRQKVKKALRSFAATVGEISEDALISKPKVEMLLKQMVADGMCKMIAHPAPDADAGYRDRLYFLVKD